MNLKGKIISFEGGEGSGKSTLIKNLVKYLSENEDVEIVQTREPGGNKISEQIRSIIVSKENKEMESETEALLFAASRAEFYAKTIKPILHTEKLVLIDRFVDSSYVYQGIGRGLGIENIKKINALATNNWLPDVTIVLDIKPELGLERINKNNRETNRLDEEGLSFYSMVREGYLNIAKEEPERVKVVDASLSEEEVLKQVLDVLKAL